MESINYIIIAILGLIIGSFLNVVILRFDDLRSIVSVRSHCPKCKKQIAWYDLFPFFSYMILAGKCRQCKANISLQYPIVELGTALIFTLLYWKFGLSLQFVFLSIISCIFIVITVYDILTKTIADWLSYLGIAIWIIYLAIDYFFYTPDTTLILNSLYGAIFFGGMLGILVLISQEKWMGKGDIALGFLIGLIAAWPEVIFSAFLSFALGSVAGITLIILKKKKMKDQLPFAPFMILGLWLSLFFAESFIQWYWGGIF